MLSELLKLTLVIILAFKIVIADEKLCPPAINYPYLPEPYICPVETAITAGNVLARNWCDLLTVENLNVLQTGLYSINATMHSVSYDPSQGKCIDTGVAPYLGILIPIIFNRTTCAEIVPTSVMVDSYNRLVVYADGISLRNGRTTTDQLLFIMEPSCPGKRGCSYQIIYQQYYETYCLFK